MAWETLASIRDQNRQEAAAERSRPPVACPIDGTPLDYGPDGVRNCPMGNFTWPLGAIVGPKPK